MGKELVMESLISEQLANLEDPRQRIITDQITASWEKTGLLEGLKGRSKRNMATLLENQLREIKTSKSYLAEGTMTQSSTGFEGWSNVALPLVRKVFANLLANEIVSVQPMNLPSGLVFYLDFQFGTASGSGWDKDKRSVGESVYGNTSSSGQPAGGYYGGVNYSYTRNFLSGTVGPFVSGVNTIANTSNYYKSASWADVDYDASLSSSIGRDGQAGSSYGLKKISVPVSSMSNIDTTKVGAISLYSVGSDPIFKQYRNFTRYDAANSAITFIVSGNSTFDTSLYSNISASWIRATTESFRGDFEIGQTGTGTDPIPELNLKVKRENVNAGTRKLKSEWTPEIQQDLAAYHDIDAEAELTSMLADQISLEIDREIIDELLHNGIQTNPFYWSRNLGNFVNPETGATISAGTFYGTQQDWYQTLNETLLYASNRIHKKTLRGAANFIVTSPEICTMLEATHSFRPIMTMDEKEVKYSLGIEKVGTLSGRWTVYKDPYFQTNKILIGYRGSTFLENGFVYAPYVPLILTPTVLDPDNFQPRKGIMTRYATKTVRPEFYGCVIVRDMYNSILVN